MKLLKISQPLKRPIALFLAAVLGVSSLGLDLTAPNFSATMRYEDNVPVAEFPERLKANLSSHPWQDGYLDITKAPYNAKGDGVTDCTTAIQQAIDDAYASNLIVYFPTGTFLVSKQLVLNQYPANWFHKERGIKFDSQRKFGNLLVGATNGAKRPVIKLKDNSGVKDDVLLLYRYYDPTEQDKEDVRAKHYLATLRGIDIDMGYNPTASGVSMDGAQYCTIQDVQVSGKAFYAGIQKIPGAVGSLVNVKVVGGEIGILSDSYVPEALVVGAILENQNQYGIKIVDSRNSPVNLVGFRIVSPLVPKPNYRAVYLDDREASGLGSDKMSRANVTLTDGSIEVRGIAGKAVESYNPYVIMKNVYVKAATVVDAGLKNAPVEKLTGKSSQWLKVSHYVFGSKENNGSIQVNGKAYGNKAADVQYAEPLLAAAPPTDLVSKHIWPIKLPSYNDTAKVNLVTQYGATPYNHSDDDSARIQKAIDDTTTKGNVHYGKAVFIPRGHFHLKKNIVLKPGVKLFGAGKNISVLHQDVSYKPSQRTYLLDTLNLPGTGVTLSDFALYKQESSKALGQMSNQYMSFLRVQNPQTVLRDVQFAGSELAKDNFYSGPEVLVTGNGGGKFYNFAVNTAVRFETGGNLSGDYRRLLISGTTNSLTLYQCGVENAEKTYKLEMNQAKNVAIYGIKYEEQNQLLKIKDSTNVSITGGYGYYTIIDNVDALIDIENSAQIYLAGLARNSMRKYDERPGKYWLINGTETLSDDYDILLYRALAVLPSKLGPELLTNGSIEHGILSWQATGQSKGLLETQYVHGGRQALKVSGQESAADTLSLDVTSLLKSGGPGLYQLGGYFMAPGQEGKSKAHMTLEVVHDGKTERFEFSDLAQPYWNKVSGQAKLSWGTLTSAKIVVANHELEGAYYLDNLSIKKFK